MLKKKIAEFQAYFAGLSRTDRAFTTFWLIGPFLMLIERSPADFWISVISLSFVFRSFVLQDFSWARYFWVKAVFVFWSFALLSAFLSAHPFYSLGEAAVWIRFPLFATATAFFLARDKYLLNAMLVSTAISIAIMCNILILELIIEGPQPRLSWPFGDLVSGNHLAKVGLPIVVIAAAFITSGNIKTAGLAAMVLAVVVTMTLFTGERINFLIALCAAMLSYTVCCRGWKPAVIFSSALLVATAVLIFIAPHSFVASVTQFVDHLPIHPDSNYYRAIAAGWFVFEQYPIVGIGPGNFRLMCPEILNGNIQVDCHNHPHNFYSQLLAETGLLGFFAGSSALGSIVYFCWSQRSKQKFDLSLKCAWIIPFALFWPLKTNADFFGQWNNSFMWSAIAIALAIAHLKGCLPSAGEKK